MTPPTPREALARALRQARAAQLAGADRWRPWPGLLEALQGVLAQGPPAAGDALLQGVCRLGAGYLDWTTEQRIAGMAGERPGWLRFADPRVGALLLAAAWTGWDAPMRAAVTRALHDHQPHRALAGLAGLVPAGPAIWLAGLRALEGELGTRLGPLELYTGLDRALEDVARGALRAAFTTDPAGWAAALDAAAARLSFTDRFDLELRAGQLGLPPRQADQAGGRRGRAR